MAKPNNKNALLEAAGGGKTVTVADPVLAAAVAEFASYKALASEAEKAIAAHRETIEAALVKFGAAVLVTNGGTVSLTTKSREGLDKTLIPAELLEAAKTTLTYTELRVAGTAA